MDKLLDYVCDELDEIEHKIDENGKLTSSEILYADTLAHIKKNLLKAEEYVCHMTEICLMQGKETVEADTLVVILWTTRKWQTNSVR